MFLIALAIACFAPSPDPTTPDDRIRDELSKIREEQALGRQELTRISRDMGTIVAKIDEMPHAYVPRSEHDLRDRALDVSGRLQKLEDGVQRIEDKQGDWFFKILMIIAGTGAGGTGTYAVMRWHHKEDEAHTIKYVRGIEDRLMQRLLQGRSSSGETPSR